MLESVGLAVQRTNNSIAPIAPQIKPWEGVPAAVSKPRQSSVQQAATGRVPAARNRARYDPVAGSSSLPTTTPRLSKTAPAVATSSTPPPTTQATSTPTALGRQPFNAPWHDDTKMRKLAVAGDYLRSLAPDEYRAPDGTFFCPFAQCGSHASGIATMHQLQCHIVRCGDPTRCKLCNKKVERGHSSHEMARHRRGGMGRGVKGTSKRNDCRVPCAYIKGECGAVDGDTKTIYNHMVEDGILDSVIDDPQLGSKVHMLGPRLRAFRAALLQQQMGSGDETDDAKAA
ncbi:hypothetical protein EXIGLDRAFT_733241 [Exidia glandulosa HHB12029]|uniref:Uncharacterized protein n=1 Tax=Exidia glandulosa HHB12029 TaxID=1314781 RepID=A0A165BCP4_EXIGL|nr:hypothetical protein EXIGLDRAFT_733241 [Exidia glandulosa HHB12029]